MPLFTPLAGYPRIAVVGSFEELLSTRFDGGVNALCWPRTLAGDFAEIVGQLPSEPGIASVDEPALRALELSPAGRAAREILLEDQAHLRAHRLDPVLEIIDGYLRDEPNAIVPTDVISFHVDSAPVEAETWLCTYHGAWSEGLRNDQARRRIEVPETRAKLLDLHRREGGSGLDDVIFHEWLAENCFDLHYTPSTGAEPWGFGLGHLWRIACEYPGSPVPPCIHRAPETRPGEAKRLLLIS